MLDLAALVATVDSSDQLIAVKVLGAKEVKCSTEVKYGFNNQPASFQEPCKPAESQCSPILCV